MTGIQVKKEENLTSCVMHLLIQVPHKLGAVDGVRYTAISWKVSISCQTWSFRYVSQNH